MASRPPKPVDIDTFDFRVLKKLLAHAVPHPDHPASGCWFWAGHEQKGYGQIRVKAGGRWRTAWVHRVSYTVFHGPIPEGMTVDHICHRSLCINPRHLRLVTHESNVHESNDRRKYGADNGAIPF